MGKIFDAILWYVKHCYYRLKLRLWAVTHLPRFLFIADTNYSIPAWNWQTAIPSRTATTKIKERSMFYEPVELPKFKELIKGRKIFFDVGTNIGYYSYFAAANGVQKIVAFEFMRDYAAFAADGFRRNGIPGVVVNRGVGLPNEKTSYSDPLASTQGTTISLDEYAKETGVYPDVIKMDIEGYELDALRNAHEILKRKPVIDISVHDSFLAARGQSSKEVLDLLASYGYRVLWSGGDTYFMRTD